MKQEYNVVEALKKHLAETPKEQLDKEYEDLKQWNEVGPTVEEFLYGKRDFGWALDMLKSGHLVAREGWNGKNMFLWLKPSGVVKAEWCQDKILKHIAELNGGETQALGTICMKTADNKILSGWLASQTDMLSEDWVEVTLED